MTTATAIHPDSPVAAVTGIAMPADAPHQPTPTRVLLVGQDWQLLDSALSAAASCGTIALLGPEPAYDAATPPAFPAPAVLLLAPDVNAAGPYWPESPESAPPPALRCVPHADLDDPDLYDAAADFIAVPCPPAELVKRILRLAQRPENAASPAVELLRVGAITLNPATYQVTAHGRPVDLAWLEFQLLLFLMDNVGKVFTRDQLLDKVWGIQNIGGTRTVDVHIRRLRYKLEHGGDTYFRTVKNVGYGMMAP